MNRRLLAVLFSALVTATAGAVALPPQAAAAASPGPLPECRYDDLMTPRTGYKQWRRTFLDTIYTLPRSYVPPNLVSVKLADVAGKGKVRKGMLRDLRALAAAARQAGNPVKINSAYRSYEKQELVYQDHVDRLGVDQARIEAARPGHSEHQLGMTLDIGSASGGAPWSGGDWGKSPAGKWMAQNGWNYGFIMSYPKGKKAVTCYMYEPWHWRYVGRDAAAKVHRSGLTLREWLWKKGAGVS